MRARHTERSLRRMLGRTIRQIRLDQGMTLEELADRAQSHPNVMSRIELGDQGITATNLLYIAAAFQCLPGDLFRGFTSDDLAKLPRKSPRRLRAVSRK